MRVHTVKSARKAKKPRTCRRCSHEVQPGEVYRWAEPRHGPILIWCKDHYPKRSELTSSKLGTIYDAIDDFDPESYESLEDLEDAVRGVGDVAREVASEYEESIEAMPEGLQEGPVAEEMRDKISELESYADNLDGWSATDDTDLSSGREEAAEVVQELPL